MYRIGVIYGGENSEKEVSINTGRGIINALKIKGYEVIPIEYSADMIDRLRSSELDLVYIALHGKFGEDGRVQGLLDILKIPYVGSGVLASSLAMDKITAKKLFAYEGLPTALDVILIKNKSEINIKSIIEKLSLPVVIKPATEGSTVGLTIAEDEDEIIEGIEKAFNYDERIIVEQYLSGVEVTVAVLEDEDEIKALPIIEIIPKNKFYDYESKYALGGSKHIIPARIPKNLTLEVQKNAIKAHKALGCKTISRVDMIITNEIPYILEVNTLPGMTETSLFPDAAKAIGLEYADMIDLLVKITLKQK